MPKWDHWLEEDGYETFEKIRKKKPILDLEPKVTKYPIKRGDPESSPEKYKKY